MSSRRVVPALVLCACATTSGPQPASVARLQSSQDLGARRKAFEALLAEHWEYELSRNPEYASVIGDKRWNDQVSDISAGAVAADLQKTRELLARFEAVDSSGFPEQEDLTRTLLLHRFREDLEEARFESWKMPVDQMGGIHLAAAQLPRLLSFTSGKDFDDFIARCRSLPRVFDDAMANMRLGMAAGLMPPRFLLEKAAGQAAAIAAMKPEETPFAQPLASMPAAFAAGEQARIRAALLAAIRDGVLPAYAKLAKFVREEYAPKGRTEVGLWSLPNGADWYATLVRRSTTTGMTPEEIHQTGLREVARIELAMAQAAKRAGFSDLASFRASLAKNPSLHPRSREHILEIYRAHLDDMRKELPKLFGRLPKADFEVVALQAFREKEAPGAEYHIPSPDGSRPGRIEVNTGDFAHRTILEMESTAYHEAVPGHHLQLALQQELEELPPVRKHWLHYTAYIEGWALYAEKLGEEVGRYQDPYSYYGHLQDEMLRAIRLVVDTGLHAKRWSRDQVVQFFREHSTIDEVTVQSETDRYIVWPGQALGYKVGELRILALRARAQAALGKGFDVRAFHDLVLGAGPLPLDVLEARVDAWIAGQKRAGA